MSITYEVYEDRNVVITIFKDHLDAKTILEHCAMINEDRRVREGSIELLDGRELKSVEFTLDDMYKLIALERGAARIRGAKLAMVAGEAADIYGMGRMYEGHASGYGREIRVFKDINLAKKWLGIEDMEI